MNYQPNSAVPYEQGALSSSEKSPLEQNLSLSYNSSRQSIAFLDSSLSELDTLVKGIENAKVVLLDNKKDGIEQITSTLREFSSVDEIHIFSHGSSGVLQLGNAALELNSLESYRTHIEQWQQSLSSKADLLFYGCDLAATNEGVAFIDRISQISGADVAASNNLTGIGGDWQLEVTSGTIESRIALSQTGQAEYGGALKLLDNGDFEDGLSSWAAFTGTERVVEESFSGDRALLLTAELSGVNQFLSVSAGETYTLTGAAKSSSGGYTAFGLNFFDADYNFLDGGDTRVVSNSWQTYQLQKEAPEGAQFVQIWAYKNAGDGRFLVDGLTFDTDSNTPEPPEPPTSSELLSNTGFESGLSNWGGFTGTETVSTTGVFEGESALELTAANSGVAQFVVVTPGEKLTLSGYGRTSSNDYAGFGVNFYDGNYSFIDGGAGAQLLSDQWTQYERDLTVPDGTVYAQIWTYRSGANGDVFFDELSLKRESTEPTDTAAPTAALSANELSSENTAEYQFQVTYTDETAVDVSSIDGTDIRVTGPNGFAQNAALVSVETSGDGTPRTATYSISAPNAVWKEADNGRYTIRLRDNQIEDTLGNAAAATTLGRFDINITDTPEPDFGFIGLQTSTLSVDEGAGSVRVTVLRTGGSDGEVTVDYRTVDNIGRAAVAEEDYRDRAGTLTFADGQTEQSVLIPILDDTLAEGSETFGFAIDNVRGGATLLAPRTAQITINDNDTLSYRGNQYVLTSTAKTWAQAQAEAESLGGNLVTLNAAAEEAWVKQNFGTQKQFWIGLSDAAEEGQFAWASGEALTYTNWASGEPNDANAGEDFAVMNAGQNLKWNDRAAGLRRVGIIEIGDSNAPEGGEGNGLKGEYYNNKDFTNRAITRTDANIEFNWGSGSPDPSIGRETFSVRWTGRIEPLYSETYTFQTDTDDGVRLWVNNQLIIDKFFNQGRTKHTGTLTLSAGQQYDIRMEYFEDGGNASAQLSWSSASQTLEVIPRSQLYSEPISSNAPIPETVVSALSFPTAIDWRIDAQGDQMFIAEKGGKVKIYEAGELLSTPFIDISAQVNGTRDRGLLDLAIHPDFENNPYVYLLFTYDPPEVFNYTGDAGPDGNNNRAARLIRVTADADNNYRTAIAGSEVVLLGKNSTWDNFNGFVNSTFDLDEPEAGVLPDGSYLQDFLNADSESHTIGSVEFGPDGALYVSNGDGASYNRVDARATRVQDIDSLSGKILRIDPITGKGLSDNPFFNGNADANRSKVYQLGLRNPFRMTIDPDSGQLYIGDVGWTKWEEINAAGAGANFGWPYYEGGNGQSLQTGGYANLPEADDFYQNGPQVAPSLLGLSHKDDGINAIVMGDVYKGNVYASEYQGDLFFNDLGQGIVRNVSLDANGNVASVDTFATGTSYVVQMIEGPDGLLYYVNLVNGTVGRWTFS